MVHGARHAEHRPVLGRLGQIAILDQGHVVMMAGAVLPDARVEAHLGRVRPVLGRGELADLAESDDFGPETMRFLDVADVQHEMVDAARCYRLVHALFSTGWMIIPPNPRSVARVIPPDLGGGRIPPGRGRSRTPWPSGKKQRGKASLEERHQ